MTDAMNPGFQVLRRKRAVAREWVERFPGIPVANISDAMHGLGAGSAPRLRPLHSGGVLCGPAITVRTRPGDNLMVQMAMNMAVEGDVIVVDAAGGLAHAIVGERMLAYCMVKRLAGMVVHGAVRDLEWVSRQPFPVYARGVTHRGPSQNGPGEINVPIAIDGMVIESGDLMVGDEDGVLCVPHDQVAAVHARAAAAFWQHSESFGQIGLGDNDAAGYRARLEALGCWFEP